MCQLSTGLAHIWSDIWTLTIFFFPQDVSEQTKPTKTNTLNKISGKYIEDL